MRLWTGAVLACLLAGPGLAQEQPGFVTTHATARARLANTVADVAVGIEAHARALGSVHAMLAQRADGLMTYLRGEKVERLATEQVAVTPETESVRGGPDRISGYAGQMRVTFRVAADRLDSVLGGALEKGANTLESTSLTPRETEFDAARQQLAADAVRTALAQARAVAEAAGGRLGAIRRIEVDPGPGFARSLARPAPAMRAASAAPIATEAGETAAEATVEVTVTLLEH